MDGRKKAMQMLKAGQFAYVGDHYTAKRIIGDDFGYHGMCKFYLTTEPLLSSYTAMIFPVRAKGVCNHCNLVIENAHFRKVALTLIW